MTVIKIDITQCIPAMEYVKTFHMIFLFGLLNGGGTMQHMDTDASVNGQRPDSGVDSALPNLAY